MKRALTNHPLWKRGLAFFTAFAMLFAMMMPTAPVAKADGTTLAVEQYTKTSGKVAKGSTATNATYNGTWEASVPMCKIMAAMESEMSTLAKGFLGRYPYPHGKDGASTIAYVEYTVTFPKGVAIDENHILASNNTSMFSQPRKPKISNNAVTFKFPLQDQNWKVIYELYQKDVVDKPTKTINFSIPYTVKATSKGEAAKAEKMNITAQGDFSTCLSGSSWPKGMNVTNTDQSVRSLAPGFSNADCFTNASGGNPNPQTPDPKDPTNPSTPPTVKTNNVLDADLLLGTNTGNDVIEQENTAKMAFTGTLDVKPIKKQMNEIENAHKGAELDQIALSNLSSSFTATLTIPTGLRFTNSTSATFKGGNGIFEVTKTKVTGNTVTVEFTLQDTANITTYKALKDAINKVDDLLTITFNAVEFDASSKADAEYPVIGTVNGGMKATATYNKQALNFDLKWDGKQSAAGAYNNEQNQIKLVVKCTGPTGTLDGDLLINGDTQHTDVYLTGMDTPFTMTGLLNVKPIKDELSKLKAAHPQSVADKDIDVSNIKTSFTATMTLPNELKFPADAATKATLDGANGKFKIESAEVNGQTITVTMVPTLDLTKLTRPFEEISDTVQGVKDELKVNVPGITVDSTKAKSSTQYTIHGTVKGDFSASATSKSSGKTIQFNYTWNGIQQKGGEDSTDPTTKDIKLTLTTADFSQSVALCGDILVNRDTEHDAVYVADHDATVPFTGKLDVTPVKAQLKKIEEQYGEQHGEQDNKKKIDPKAIALSEYSSLFTATLTLPTEMDFVGTPSVSLKNDNDKYKIIESKVSGKTITVKMTVKADVTTFADLKDAVDNMGNALEVVVDGAKFNSQAKANTPYTVYGTMNGELKAKATHKTSGTSLTFAFTWNAKQCKDGADYLYPNSENISFSLKWKKSSPWTPPTPPTPNPPTPNPPTPNPPTPNPPTPNPPTPNPPTPNPPTPNPPTPNPPTPNPPTPNPPTPVEPNKPKPVEPTPSKPSAKTPTAPKTGDIASMLLCGGAFLLSSFGYAASKVKRGKRKHEE
ncbi:hypothetical protein [Levyella massiliensis]|uniref:hypothetical protein n=1 Tax=Levyella massiliensis TaxID=938289 RepID=UPI000379CF4B|nr:hypothetical protein [Levyella massiliensis]